MMIDIEYPVSAKKSKVYMLFELLSEYEAAISLCGVCKGFNKPV